MTRRTAEETFEMHHGDMIDTKDAHHIRIGMLNARTLPLEDQSPEKYDAMRQHILECDFDILGICEINKNWNNISEEKQMRQTMKRWWKNSSTTCTWLRDSNSTHESQTGGSSITTINKITGFLKQRGEDHRRLGRWAWHSISGQHNKTTTIISTYRPYDGSNHKPKSAKMQQFTAIREKFPQLTQGPLELYDSDLQDLIQTKLDLGHQIIVMGDLNQDVSSTTKKSSTIKMLEKLGLYEIIIQSHGKSAPATHINGKHPIDGIFATRNISQIKCGYLKGNIHVSDHRTLWVDIHQHNLLGDIKHVPQQPRLRQLQTSNPRIRKKFNKIVEAQLKQCKVLKKLQRLREDIRLNGWDQDRMAPIYETCDNLRFRAIQCADKRCDGRKGGGISFSDEIKRAMGNVTMWRLIYDRATKKGAYRPKKRYLARKASKWKFQGNIEETNIEVIKQHFSEARQHYRFIRKDSKLLRQEYLTDKAMAMAEDEGKHHGGYLKQLIKHEQTRASFRNIKAAQGKYEDLNITAIEQGPDEGPRTKIYAKKDMEIAIKNANEDKLQQSDNTPLRQEPICSIIDESHLNYERWERILTGELDIPPNAEPGTKLWLEKMRETSSSITTVPIAIDTESYIDSWKRMKETTKSAPGLHFGHFKAASDQTPTAAAVHAILAEIPIITGYSPMRWRSCTDAMLRKKANDIRPEKLRLITLMAADFNHNNKLIGKNIMWNGEKHRKFATEQFGSRKYCSAGLHALNKVLTLDCSKQRKTECTIIANDAVSCYDRIVLVAAYCSMLRFGIPAKAAQSMITSIGLLSHSIRTAHGDSSFTYGGNTWPRLPHGICQGNGAGPAIWACTSSPLFDILRNEGYGITHTSAIKRVNFQMAGFAFVDDADLIQSVHHTQSHQLIPTTQKGLTLWEQLLRTTGGAIDPKKSDWSILQYQWTHGHANIKKQKSTKQLTVRNKQGIIQPLKQISPSTARETLGCWIAIDGSKKKQRKVLLQKAKRWGQRLQVSFLSKQDAILGFRTTIMMSLKYPLLAASLDKQDCAAIMSPLLTRALPRMGMCSRIRRLVIHLPKEMGGIGIPDLWTLQGVDHIQAILDHGDTDSPTGQLLQNTLEDHIIHMGSSLDICDLPRPMYRHMEDTWIKHTLMFMNSHQIKLKHNLPPINIWGDQHDTLLMDHILPKRGNTATRLQIGSFNRCRLFLQVMTISDITTSSGHIIESAWHVHQGFISPSGEAYKWPLQKRPHSNDILVWQQLLKQTFGLSPAAPSDTPISSLTHDTTRHAKWWWDPPSNLIWERESTSWRSWQPMTNRNKDTPMYQRSQRTKQISRLRWRIATVRRIGNNYLMMVTHRPYLKPSQTIEPSPPTWPTESTSFHQSGLHTLIHEIAQGTAKVISDGSYKNGCSASAFQHISQTDPGFQGTNIVPGGIEIQNSYRSELGGILGNIMTINHICTCYNISHGTVTAGCDNTSALYNAFGHHPITTKIPSRDLVAAIRYQLHRSPIHWIPKHVKGHQDLNRRAYLDDWALGNIQVDQAANEARDQIPDITPPTQLPGEMWSIVLQDTTIVSNIATTIYRQCYQQQAIDYWVHRGRITTDNEHLDWKVLRTATQMVPEHRLIFLAKLYAGYGPTGKVMFRRKKWPVNACPRCGDPEDHQHIIQCNSATAKEEFLIRWGELDDWVMKTSSPDISEAICTILTDYRDGNLTLYPSPNWSPIVQTAIQEQQRLGKRSFIEGMLCTHWAQAQQEYLQLQGDTRRSATRWAATLTTKLWNLTHQMWSHRNHILHHTDEAQQIIFADTTKQQLQEVYKHKSPTMPSMDLHLFRRSLEDTLKLPLAAQRRLLRQLQAAKNAHDERTSSPSAQALHTWLHQPPPA